MSKRLQTFLQSALIGLTGWLIYSNTLKNPFIFDDEPFIVRNTQLNPARWVGTWTFSLNHAWGGLEVYGYHLVNIILHILCALTAAWLVRLILSTLTSSLNQNKDKIAFWAGLLFLVHPVQTMAVNHLTQRYVLLAALFYLSALCFYFKARLSLNHKEWFMGAMFLVVMLGIFTRQTFLSLPAVIILCEAFLLGGFKSLDGRLRLWCVLLPLGIATLFGLAFYGPAIFKMIFGTSYPSQSHEGEVITWWNYAISQFKVFLVYLKVIILPVGLNFDYDMHVAQGFFNVEVMAGLLAVLGLLWTAWKVKGRHPLISFSILWFFVTIAIESTIIPIPYLIAEYRLYLPLFGVCLAVIYAVATWVRPQFFLSAVAVIVLAFAVLTMQRNADYSSGVYLWQDALEKSPHKLRPYLNLSSALLEEGRYEEALIVLNQTGPLGGQKDTRVLFNLAVIYEHQEKREKAIQILNDSLKIAPTAGANYRLGILYEYKGELERARRYFNKAISLYDRSGYPEIRLALARVLLKQNKLKDAEMAYVQISLQYPKDQESKIALMQIYLLNKDYSRALILAEKFLRSDDNYDPQVLRVLSQAFAQQGFNDVAQRLLEKAGKNLI